MCFPTMEPKKRPTSTSYNSVLECVRNEQLNSGDDCCCGCFGRPSNNRRSDGKTEKAVCRKPKCRYIWEENNFRLKRLEEVLVMVLDQMCNSKINEITQEINVEQSRLLQQEKPQVKVTTSKQPKVEVVKATKQKQEAPRASISNSVNSAEKRDARAKDESKALAESQKPTEESTAQACPVLKASSSSLVCCYKCQEACAWKKRKVKEKRQEKAKDRDKSKDRDKRKCICKCKKCERRAIDPLEQQEELFRSCRLDMFRETGNPCKDVNIDESQQKAFASHQSWNKAQDTESARQRQIDVDEEQFTEPDPEPKQSESCCSFCRGQKLPVLTGALSHTVGVFIGNHEPQCVSLVVNELICGNYHLRIIGKNHKHLGCIVATENALRDAATEGLFKCYLTIFVLKSENLQKAKENFTAINAFEIVNR